MAARLVLAVALGGVALGGCGGGDDEAAEPAGTATATEAAGNVQAGRGVYDEAGCGGCHTFSAAGSSGTVGPNLDEIDDDEADVAEQVREGGDGMPAFEGRLSEQEIADVTAFVVQEREE